MPPIRLKRMARWPPSTIWRMKTKWALSEYDSYWKCSCQSLVGWLTLYLRLFGAGLEANWTKNNNFGHSGTVNQLPLIFHCKQPIYAVQSHTNMMKYFELRLCLSSKYNLHNIDEYSTDLCTLLEKRRRLRQRQHPTPSIPSPCRVVLPLGIFRQIHWVCFVPLLHEHIHIQSEREKRMRFD